MRLHFPVVCSRCCHGLWQANGHHKSWRAQRILHPCHQNSRWLALTLLVINAESRVLCTSYSWPLCPVSVRGSGASPPRRGLPARLLSQRWLRRPVPEKGDVEDHSVLQHRPLCGLPLPAGDSSSSSISQRNKSGGFGLPLNVFLCVFSSRLATSTVSWCSQAQQWPLRQSSRWRSSPLCSMSLRHEGSRPHCESQYCWSDVWLINSLPVDSRFQENVYYFFMLKSSIISVSQRQPCAVAKSLKNPASLANF